MFEKLEILPDIQSYELNEDKEQKLRKVL